MKGIRNWDFSRRHTRSVLEEFADIFLEYQENISFKVSARGWCYLMEQAGFINKSEFDKVNDLLNRARKEGLLPVDFCAEDVSRQFHGIEHPSGEYDDFVDYYLNRLDNCEYAFVPDWWEGEKYYIQMIVEKVDLVTLFSKVNRDYHIPIANTKGWSSILQRAQYARRFRQAQAMGLQPVLLYCGDHDPDGLRISDFLRRNLEDVSKVTWNDGLDGYDPSDLIIERFGLNYDFIMEHDLTWIDNLITGGNKNLASPTHRNFNLPYVQSYLKEFGERKCEANAIVVIEEEAYGLCERAIEKYLGEDSRGRFKAKKDKAMAEISALKDGVKLYKDDPKDNENVIPLNGVDEVVEEIGTQIRSLKS